MTFSRRLIPWLAWLLVAPALAQKKDATTPQYESEETRVLIEKMIDAHGGLARWQRSSGLGYDFVMYLPTLPVNDDGSEWQLWRMGHYRVDIKNHRGYVDLPLESASIASDGKSVWSVGYGSGNPPFFRLWHHATYVNLPWLTQHPSIHVLEPSEGYIPGSRKRYHKLRLIFEREGVLRPEGYIDLYVDPETHLLTASKYTTFYAAVPQGLPANFNPFGEVLRITDSYATVDGLVIPSRYRSYDPGKKKLFGMHLLANPTFKAKLDRSRLKPTSEAVVARYIPSLRTYEARKLSGVAPKIDGKLGDRAWKKASWEEGFVTGNGGDAGELTRICLAFDARHLYVALDLRDSRPGEIVKVPGEKDDVNGDRIALFLDTNLDRTSAHVFVINAAGVQRDQVTRQNGATFDNGYDAKWDSAVAVDGRGWSAEMKIPLTAIAQRGKPSPTWGFQLTRFHQRTESSSFWNPLSSSGFIGSFGRLSGVDGLSLR